MQRSVGRDLHAEPRPRRRHDPVTGERDVADDDVERPPRLRDVPSAVLGRKPETVNTRAQDPPLHAPVPLQARMLLLLAGEDDLGAVDVKDPVRRLTRSVRDDDSIATAVAVRGEAARCDRDERDPRRGRVHAHVVRQVDRPVLVGEVDARLVNALRDEAALVVAPVPGVRDGPAPEALPGDKRAHDRVAANDLETDAIGLAEPEPDRGHARRAVADRREDLVDPRREDRAGLDLQALGDRERGGRPAQQRDHEGGREQAGHSPRVYSGAPASPAASRSSRRAVQRRRSRTSVATTPTTERPRAMAR